MVEMDSRMQKQALKPGELIGYASKVLSTFNVKEHSGDAHLRLFLQEKSFHPDDEVFITEVFAGCVRYNHLLKVVVDGFYTSNGKTCLKCESSSYYVVCYLLTFRLDELGMKQFRRLIISQSTGKMLKFLKFFFDEGNLNGWIRNEWYKTYDKSFVDSNIISKIQRHESEMREFISEYLVAKDNNTLPPSNNYKITTTEVKPFNLTNPKPRRIPTPEEIPTMKAHNPIPESTYIPPRESETARMNKETLRIRAERKLEEAERLKFSCANTEKSLKTKNVIRQIMEEREAKLEHVKVKPTPFPSSMTQSQSTKLNTTAILREGARIQKAAEDENKRLAELEAGQKDITEFEKWHDEMIQKDIIKQQADNKRKHLVSKLSYEDAILAKQNHIEETKQKVCQIKEEYDSIMNEYFTQQEEDKKNMRKMVEQILKGQEGAREARIQLQQMKHKIVQQVDKESQELMAKALEKAEHEMRQKVELIQQIRAMESVPVIRKKFVDLTITSGQGLLSEMSIVELRERLSLLKLTNEEEKEKKRKEITATKEAKDQALTDTLEAISEYKCIQQHHNELRKAQQRNNVQLLQDCHDKELLELQQKLEAKRKARENLKQTKGSDVTIKITTKTKSRVQNDQSIKNSAIQTLLRSTGVSSNS